MIRSGDLDRIHRGLEGRGYLPKFNGSKNLRDTETGVSIKFLLSGEYPGDGRPKPVTFPDPTEVSVEIDGVKCLMLSTDPVAAERYGLYDERELMPGERQPLSPRRFARKF